MYMHIQSCICICFEVLISIAVHVRARTAHVGEALHLASQSVAILVGAASRRGEWRALVGAAAGVAVGRGEQRLREAAPRD
jgi:hypothetical protein